ncbi:hypothetical protein PRZ48_004325 [Zasmidium cellare]|uniref:Uncharacterized protein n=1 Tax=Zasmidium cellare TaxID=395010 RepID=A0ABR0EQ82_ZASCE|nr:hypothetical protein PRZ48_004325 [Zasmidium cellare]
MPTKCSVAAQQYSQTTTNDKHAWRPGLLRRFPYLGSLSLLGALTCILAAIVILASSNNTPLADWTYSPSVYVSITYTIFNLLLQDALSSGVVVAWWTTALRDGTTILDLHETWDFGHSALAAVRGGWKRWNFVALAAVVVAFAPVNGPLLQRASEVRVGRMEGRVNVTVNAARGVEWATGYMSGRLRVVPLLSEGFAGGFQLSAAGLAVNCSSYTVPYNVVPDEGCNSITGSTQQCIDAQAGFIMFRSNISWFYDKPGQLNLDVQYKDQAACTGEMTIQNCTLRAATVRYPVIIDGDTSTIYLDPKSTIFDDVVDFLGDYTDPGIQGPTQLGGYAHALSDIFYGVSHIRWAGAVGYEVLSTGPSGTRFANLTEAQRQDNGLTQGLCNIFFNDPVPDLLQQARELMFRTALMGSNETHRQTIELNQVRTAGVYQSNYAYLGAAAAVSLIAILIVLGTFNQFWLLGRKVSMSPIETAKAFDAPVLKGVIPNKEVKEIVKDVGMRAVQYGGLRGPDVGVAQMPGEPPVYFEGPKGVEGCVRGVGAENVVLTMGDPAEVEALILR